MKKSEKDEKSKHLTPKMFFWVFPPSIEYNVFDFLPIMFFWATCLPDKVFPWSAKRPLALRGGKNPNGVRPENGKESSDETPFYSRKKFVCNVKLWHCFYALLLLFLRQLKARFNQRRSRSLKTNFESP